MNDPAYHKLQKKSIALQEKVDKLDTIICGESMTTESEECKCIKQSSTLRTEIRNFLSLFVS